MFLSSNKPVSKFVMEGDKEERNRRVGRKKKEIARHGFSSCRLSSSLSVQSRLGVKLKEGSDTEQ